MGSTNTSTADMGYADGMGDRLTAFVEDQLVRDLNVYRNSSTDLHRRDVIFDWSECMIEGHQGHYFGGTLESVSEVSVLDCEHKTICTGWIEFIEPESGRDADLIVYWHFLHKGGAGDVIEKTTNDIPMHIWSGLSEQQKIDLNRFRPNPAR